MQETYVIENADQLQAISHPLRVRLLEALGQDADRNFTKAELSEQLDKSAAILWPHLKGLVEAGLIEQIEGQKFRPVARVFRVSPELRNTGSGKTLQTSMLRQVELGLASFGDVGQFSAGQLELRLGLSTARELIASFLSAARDLEDPDEECLLVTMFVHPPAEPKGSK